MADSVTFVDRLRFLHRTLAHTNFSADTARKIKHNLLRATPDEIVILSDVLMISPTHWFTDDILGGAHVTIRDAGKLYNTWKTLGSASTRRSSHKSDGNQYHVDGPLSHTILFGMFRNETWMQLENHPFGARHFIGHTIDFFKYKASGENQGPYGSSKYTDSKPLQVIPPPKLRVVVVPATVIR